MVSELFFWILSIVVIYSYLLYPLILIFIAKIKLKQRDHKDVFEYPTVSIVISVYNEELVLLEKLKNFSLIDYPKNRIELLVGSDASSDQSNNILSQCVYPNVRVHIYNERRGKTFILNELLAKVTSEIVVFSDANTMFRSDTVTKLVRRFCDKTVGAVSGELILESTNDTIGSHGEHSYWSYENFLKNLESRIYSTLGATGAVYAIRKTLFKKLPSSKTVTDDFLIPMNIIRQGYRIVYDNQALAYEKSTGSISGEFQRKIRIGASNYQSISEFVDLLHPSYGFLSFALWSHKIIRWLIPLILPYVLIIPLFLSMNSKLYGVILTVEEIFLGIVAFGFVSEKLKWKIGFLGLPYYFIAMNIALFIGFIKFLFKLQKPTWNVIR